MSSYQSEIHKLLKLTGSTDESHIHLVQAGAPVLNHASLPSIPPAMNGMNHIDIPRISFRKLLIYPAIFFTAFAFFYVVLNFPSMWAQLEGVFAKPQAEQILGSDSPEYYKWISNYFYAVGDPKLLEPTNDIDKDGLSNYDEFVIKTNPILPDSDSDGFSDGIEVINYANVWGTGSMTKAQRALAEKLDLILINNRVSGNIAQNNSGIVAGDVTSNYDLERAGRLSIPKLNIQVPLIWSKDPNDFNKDLTLGPIHYPGTALPGQSGVVYVSGHSSDYLWKKNPMGNIFAKLNFLSAGDDVFVDVYGKDGKVYNFRYKVTVNHVYKADDQAQFFDSSGTSKLNLSTCWPIGTSKDRLVVTAVATGL